MPNLRDLTGQRFGKWTVLERAPNQKNLTFWKCQCDCGTVRDVRGSSLTTKSSTNCGCVRKQKLSEQGLDLTNQRYGKLVVIEKDVVTKKWKCQCDCGNIVFLATANLRDAHTRSCGCLIQDKAKERIRDLTGQKFGLLTALEVNESDTRKGVHWKCLCDCGNIVSVASSSLVSGLTKSCGCLRSQGEREVAKILRDNGILFETQKSFENCRFPDTNRVAHFDFYVNQKYLIEYDGLQHFKYSEHGWDTKEHFEKVQKRDFYKNQWCKENKIPLIRIPYTKLNTLSIEDLLLETSKFII